MLTCGITHTVTSVLDGTAMRARRHQLGLTLEQLSDRTAEAGHPGISVSLLNDMEHSRRNGSVLSLVRICRALDCDPGQLLNLEAHHD